MAAEGTTEGELLVDPDCRDGKHGSCIGGPCECDCHRPVWGEPTAANPAAERRRRALRDLPATMLEPCSFDDSPDQEAELARAQGEIGRLHARIKSLEGCGEDLLHRAERAEAKLHKVAMVKVWTNEDGKRFVFVDDLTPILLPDTAPKGHEATDAPPEG